MATAFALVELYLAPFLVAIGLVFLLNGAINYFIIGHIGLEEDRREIGRQSLLWATLFFLAAFIVYSIFSGLLSLTERIGEETGGSVEVESGGDLLKVPNVPSTR